ncbi:hypothetical protein K0M31_009110 [Melipona bicolor]|uniref:Peptidase S1 domain-containing protein n=1 Tax=Melipona bicolor TaxID=60889 RepID=A0AA40FNY1_9HYME|nr:hypothetical protein K0M31_009110 [Melipona bicolor]
MTLSGAKFTILFSLLFCAPIFIDAQYEGDRCTFKDLPGICTVLDEQNCPSVYQDLLAGIPPPPVCGYKRFKPIICCPTKSTSTTETTTTTTIRPTTTTTIRTTTTTTIRTTTTSRPTTTTITTSPDIDDRPSLNRKGAKARAKCEEYAKSVFTLVQTPVLIFDQNLVNVSLCGIKTRKLIVGGTKAEPKEFPHMAAIGYDSRSGVVWQCGGTLISERFVLSAAHCISSVVWGKANWVRLGDLNLKRTDDDARPQDFQIVKRIKHPKYSIRYSYHDIALFKLEKDVEFSAYIRPSCLPYSSPDVDTDKATATGWGADEYLGDPTNDLLKVTINLVSQSICNRSYGYDSKLPRGIVDEWQICAGENGKDTCQGDSGGPLSIFNTDYYCMYNLIGITSFGIVCGENIPGVYTRVYNYISWIERTVWPDF